MQKKLRFIVDEVTYEDLYKMKADLDNGGENLKKLVERKISDIENTNVKICATCGNPINLLTTRSYTLVFGPPDLRKQAHFCAMDCLEYFIQNLKGMEKNKIRIKEKLQ